MKKNFLKVVISTLSVGLLATIIPLGMNGYNADTNQVPETLSSEITVKNPGIGSTVSFLPNSLSSFMGMDDLITNYPEKKNDIGELTPYSSEVASLANLLNQPGADAACREIFKKYDLFVPTNNILSWNSNVGAKEYKIIISQDKSLSRIEREYTVNGTESSVVFENPYTGVDYYWQVIATKNDDSKVYSDIFNFSVANLPRTVLIEGVSNTRDFGGNVGANNKRTKQGLLYRGMRLEAITDKGENEYKNNLGIKTELDLRLENDGVKNFHNLSSNYYCCPAPFDYTNGTESAYSIENFSNTSLVPTFGNAIKVLADKNNYPVYFHCSVGRDRTGWLALCLNFLCGVSEEAALKDFCLSLFSASGAYLKSTLEFYNRYIRIRDYINTFEGNNLSEKMEDYLVKHTTVTHKDCENVRKILLGDIDTGFVVGQSNPNAYTNLAKVTFRKYGETSIIKMIQKGSLLSKPLTTGNGTWYCGDHIWDFANDIVNDDMYLDYVTKDNFKVLVQYNGINLPSEVIDVPCDTELDFSRFQREGYSFKVYDDSYNQLQSLTVTDDMTINVIYASTSSYIPKRNSRIIVMAGQSNGAGVGHYQYLENSLDQAKLTEINNGYSNVLLTGYSHGANMDGFEPVYADINYNTAGAVGTFGFEVGMADRLSKAFPGETTYIVKYAYGGASLNYDWISPSSLDTEICVTYDAYNPRGWLYTGLVNCLTDRIQRIGEMTNTIPMVEGLMWMQGETDAYFETSNNLYLETFNNFMDDFLTTFKDNISTKFALYDAAICETSQWKYSKIMNAIKRSRVDDKNIYIETNTRLTTSFEPIGFDTDNAHYDAACYIDLGHMFADAYLSKTVRGYTHDVLEIELLENITITKGENFVFDTPKVTFNGVEVEAKMSYFAMQHKAYNGKIYSMFTINGNTLTATKVGSSVLRITAYYSNEVRTVLIPVEIVE